MRAAKTPHSKSIEAVERGEKVIITRHETPVAELVPARQRCVRLGSLEGVVTLPGDDFLVPLSEEELRDWGAI